MARWDLDTLDDLLDECIEQVRKANPNYDNLREKNIIINNGTRLLALRRALEGGTPIKRQIPKKE